MLHVTFLIVYWPFLCLVCFLDRLGHGSSKKVWDGLHYLLLGVEDVVVRVKTLFKISIPVWHIKCTLCVDFIPPLKVLNESE